MGQLGYETRPRGEDDEFIEVWFNNKLFFEWHDHANAEYPEDLCWNRMIGEVFRAGIDLGMEMTKVNNQPTGGE
jgi:hypothetical protein